jgi:hypothetical protein
MISGTAAAPATSLKTPWGEPDLQGIWTDENDTPFQRPPKYADQEFLTEAQRAELDKARSELLGRDRRAQRGTERDVSGSYNNVFVSMKRVGARTSLIVDPPNGRMPPLTPEAQRCRRQFRLALLQSTGRKNKEAACQREYDPRRRHGAELLRATLRHESQRWSGGQFVSERCLTGGLPGWNQHRRLPPIVQTPGGIAISTTWVSKVAA